MHKPSPSTSLVVSPPAFINRPIRPHQLTLPTANLRARDPLPLVFRLVLHFHFRSVVKILILTADPLGLLGPSGLHAILEIAHLLEKCRHLIAVVLFVFSGGVDTHELKEIRESGLRSQLLAS